MFSRDGRIKLYTQKAASLLSLRNAGLPIPPTLFVDYSNKYIDTYKINDYLRNTSSQLYYLRLCFSDNQYPHYFSELITKCDVLNAISRLLDEAEKAEKENFDIIIQPLQMLTVSGAILVRHNRMLIESVLGAPPTLFRKGNINSRHVLDSGNLVYQEYYQQDNVLYWDTAKSNWVQQNCDERIDFDIISPIANMTLQNFSLYEYGIDQCGEFWIFEKKTVPPNCYISLDSIECDEKYFTISEGKHFDIKHIEIPDFSEISTCSHDYKYVVNSGAYTAHLPTYLALNNIACQFRKV